jgi:hypothetical protein
MRALFVLFGWQTAERKAVTTWMELGYYVMWDTQIGRMSLRTPRNANSILACTLKRRQPRLKAPFNHSKIFPDNSYI